MTNGMGGEGGGTTGKADGDESPTERRDRTVEGDRYGRLERASTCRMRSLEGGGCLAKRSNATYPLNQTQVTMTNRLPASG